MMHKIRTLTISALLILTFTWGAALLGGHDSGGLRAYSPSAPTPPPTAHITYHRTPASTLPNGDKVLQEDDPEIVHDLLTCYKAGMQDCHLERDTDGQLRVYASKVLGEEVTLTR